MVRAVVARRKPTRYKEIRLIESEIVEEPHLGRFGTVTVDAWELDGGFIRVFDVCDERLQADGDEVDVVLRPFSEEVAVRMMDWLSKNYDRWSSVLAWGPEPIPPFWAENPRELRKCGPVILFRAHTVKPPFRIPETCHGFGEPPEGEAGWRPKRGS
ncbi:MAG: hypothetical protein QXO51_07935 [Halobacteria archaeon]